MRYPAAILASVALFVVTHTALGQAGNDWIGRRVVMRPGMALKVGNQVVGEGAPDAFRVERVNGPWLWLVAETGRLRGWALMSQVVRFDPEQPPQREPAAPTPGAGVGQPPQEPEGSLVPAAPPIDYAALAGLASGTAAPVLTLERAYTLALVKARAPRPSLAATLDVKALDDQAAALGVADFARFRDEFLGPAAPPAGRPEGQAAFRDPSGPLLGALADLMAAENAGRYPAAFAPLRGVATDLLKGDLPGLGAMFYRLDNEIEQARRIRADARRDYRDRLDALKVELGLSPHAPVVADAASLAPFRDVFVALDRWAANPSRDPRQVPAIVNRLAPLEGAVLDFAPDRPTLVAVAADTARLEPVLQAAESLAVANRGGHDPDGTIALRVRRLVRHLVEEHAAYESAKRALVALVLLKDEEYEIVMNPPAGSAGVTVSGRKLAVANAAMNDCESRLVSRWAAFHTDRIALARELWRMPASDWESFYASFSVPVAAAAGEAPQRAPR
jgi:hypothetical protein